MGVNKPYYRTCRQFKDGRYSEGLTTDEVRRAKEVLNSMTNSGELFDPNISRLELEKLGIDIHTAALQAIRWFERALSLKSDSASQSQIR
jgi:hypothetical protein